MRGFGTVEVVTHDRYALFRTTRIFADLTVMRQALRVVIHLDREVGKPIFVNVGPSGKRISHVALLRSTTELSAVLPFLREAYELAASEEGSGTGKTTSSARDVTRHAIKSETT